MTSFFLKPIASISVAVLWLAPALAESKGSNGWSIGSGLQQSRAHVVTMSPLGNYDSKDNFARAYVDGRYQSVIKKPLEVQLSMAISPGTSPAGGFLASGSYSLKDTMSMSVAPGIRLNERTLIAGVLSVEHLTLEFSQRNLARSSSIDGVGVGVSIQYVIASNLIAEMLYKEVEFGSARIPFDADLKTRNIAFALHRRF